MKIGFLIQGNEDFEKWAQFADGIGIDGIEIDYVGNCPYEFDTEKIKAAFAHKRVKPCALSIWHINTIAKASDERKKADAIIEKFLNCSAAVGAPVAFMNTGIYEENNTEKNLEEFARQHEKYSKMAGDRGLSLSYYLGHKGNFINSKEILTRACTMLPNLKLKLDPVGLERNSHADPYEIISLFGDRINHFHCKDIIRYKNGFEIEPPVGLGDIAWNRIIGMLYHFGYDGYLVIEPHGKLWEKAEVKAGHIILSQRHLKQFIL
jgi:sugar phosphate isomerase/epimerase